MSTETTMDLRASVHSHWLVIQISGLHHRSGDGLLPVKEHQITASTNTNLSITAPGKVQQLSNRWHFLSRNCIWEYPQPQATTFVHSSMHLPTYLLAQSASWWRLYTPPSIEWNGGMTSVVVVNNSGNLMITGYSETPHCCIQQLELM